jgi:CheY-like chemotaxis protein
VSEARAEGASDESIAFALETIETQARFARDLARRAIGGEVVTIVDDDDALEGVVAKALSALFVEATRAHARIVYTTKSSQKSPQNAKLVRVPRAIDVAQILTNLVLNALAHAPRETEVSVEVTTTDSNVLIEVTDRGEGVASSRAGSVFEGDSLRAGGVGLGLRYSRNLARAAGGDLELVMRDANHRDHEGARFRLTWPRDAHIPRPPVSVPRLRLLEGQRILLIEDDVAVTELLEAALGARGATLTIARNASEIAAAYAGDAPHDIALIDLSPIASNVPAAFAALRAHSPAARIIVITGSADSVPDFDGIRVVRKPFEVGEIVAALLGA